VKIKESILSTAIFAASVFAAGYAMPVAAATGEKTRTGMNTLKLQYIYAVQQNGSADPIHDAACKKLLSESSSRFIGMPVTTRYAIDAKSLMMSAESGFPSPHATEPLELNVKLNPLGIRGTYAFGAFRSAALPDAYVLFSISENFASPVSSFLVFGPKDQRYNCVISSAKDVFKHAESEKLKVG